MLPSNNTNYFIVVNVRVHTTEANAGGDWNKNKILIGILASNLRHMQIRAAVKSSFMSLVYFFVLYGVCLHTYTVDVYLKAFNIVKKMVYSNNQTSFAKRRRYRLLEDVDET